MQAEEPTEAEREARRLRGQKAARTRAANRAAKEAQEAREAATKATTERKRLVSLEPDLYARYDKALKHAMSVRGEDFAAAWRKVERAQQSCLKVSKKLREENPPLDVD